MPSSMTLWSGVVSAGSRPLKFTDIVTICGDCVRVFDGGRKQTCSTSPWTTWTTFSASVVFGLHRLHAGLLCLDRFCKARIAWLRANPFAWSSPAVIEGIGECRFLVLSLMTSLNGLLDEDRRPARSECTCRYCAVSHPDLSFWASELVVILIAMISGGHSRSSMRVSHV